MSDARTDKRHILALDSRIGRQFAFWSDDGQ